MQFYTNVTLIGNKIGYRGVSNGQRVHKTVNYSPTLFMQAKEKTGYKDIYGKHLKPYFFDGIKEAREFLQKHEGVSELNIFGNTNFPCTFISEQHPEEYIEYDPNLIRTCFIDIETSSEFGFPNLETCLEKIVAITCHIDKRYYVFGLGEYKPHRKDIEYKKCSDEFVLLRSFLDFWAKANVDSISGWNTTFFDIPYLIKRITKLLGEDEAKKLSPWNRLKERSVILMGREHTAIDIVGIASLDLLDAYKKFALTSQENYKLDTVAKDELGEEKVKYEGTLDEFYKRDHQKYIEYNIKDVELVLRLEEKRNLIGMIYGLAYASKTNYQDTFSQVRMWDSIIYNELAKDNIHLPQRQDNIKDAKFEGAYVKDVQVGLHDYVCSFDLTSLYPHIIAQWNISPEKLKPKQFRNISVDGLLRKEYDFSHLQENEICIAGNGHCFSVDEQGFLPRILMRMFQERKQFKDMAQNAKKELQLVEAELRRRGISS